MLEAIQAPKSSERDAVHCDEARMRVEEPRLDWGCMYWQLSG
ncbi:MAG: hypothetical protein Q9P01_22475 [Anaerolineae bacterium]|nr:hypothetical protein [Anaerolineae bacterium]